MRSRIKAILRGLPEHWPVIMAVLFSAFTLVLLWFLSSSETQLRLATDARFVADNKRRAAAIADFVKERQQAVSDLATIQEIDHYLTNRALGMSPRYGLNASLNFVEQRFRRQIDQKTLRGQPVYRRILFIDAGGSRLIDTAGRDDADVLLGFDGAARVMVDFSSARIVATAPVFHKGTFSGTVITMTDLNLLTRLLIDSAAKPGAETKYREFLISASGAPILQAGQSTPNLTVPLAASLNGLPENRLLEASRYPGTASFGDVLLLRTAVAGVPLSVVTLISRTEAYGQLTSPAYTFYIGGFSVVLLLSALAFERMRRRTLQLQEDYSASDRHRAELAQRNEALSSEIARRRAVESALNEKTETLDRANADLRIAAAAFDAQEGMVVTDADHVVLRVNRAFMAMTGDAAEDVVGRAMNLLDAERHDAEAARETWDRVLRIGGWQGEIHGRTKTGKTYTRWLTISAVKDAAGAVTHYIGTYYDVSERKRAEERIKELAFFDQLTGLPNRALLRDRMKQVINANTRDGTYGALLFIDLDNFKILNDTLGHDVGDLLLKEVARRLTRCVRATDTVARLGGDEFVVLLSGLSTEEQEAAIGAKEVGEKVLAALNQSCQLGIYEHLSTPSIGVTLIAGHQCSIDELLKRADLAMYEAKAAGRNTLRFFDPAMQTVVNARAALETDLREGIKKSQFLLHYQPQVDRAGHVIGAEALLRWPHPHRGIVPPNEFIPLAEHTGLIRPLGRWVMETACRQLAAWAKQAETAHLTIAVNVSALQLHHKDFVDHVVAAIEGTGADPRHLKLELTESLLVNNVEDVIEKMMALMNKGIRFSLDDFGTGYSSLAYLKRLPLDELKIDQGFVRDILIDPNDAAIARTIILLGESLGLSVIAEGVESEAQRMFLDFQGCDAYQGYLFGWPIPAEEFEVMVRARSASMRSSHAPEPDAQLAAAV